MDITKIYGRIKEFSQKHHGHSSYSKENTFVKGQGRGEYAPFKFLVKKINDLSNAKQLDSVGMICDSLAFTGDDQFIDWFQRQFTRQFTNRMLKNIVLWRAPRIKPLSDCINQLCLSYEFLRKEKILINGKNLPTQLGEWYAKCIFNLDQRKTASQRGFDFFLEGKRIEVKIHRADKVSLKGIKIRKSLVDLSEYIMIIYLGRDLKIQEICLLDSKFVMRKFSTKGHTIFLKEEDISPYFFGLSPKHIDKVARKSLFVRFLSTDFTMKIADHL